MRRSFTHRRRNSKRADSCAVEDQFGKKVLIIPERSYMIRRPRQEVPHQKLESLQKELLTKIRELEKTQNVCE